MMTRSIVLAVAMVVSALIPRVEDDWEDRLTALTPDDPAAYFDLAEEIADAAQDEEDRALARHLFGLAGALDIDRFARSACLALADLNDDPTEKRRLLALARLLDERLGDQGWVTAPGAEAIDAAAALALVESFSYYRRGQGARALALLDDGGGAALFARYADAIGGEARFRENARRYRGGESPVKSDAEVGEMLLLESGLLAGGGRSWSADLLLHRGRTLVEVDPERIGEALGVDPSRSVRRNERWVAPATGGEG